MKSELLLPDGVFTATLTPLNKNLDVDSILLVSHMKWLLDNGSNGIALLGTTGEANSFSSEERMKILDLAIRGGVSAKKLMVGTGCCSFSETARLTQHAVDNGVGGILLLPPFYYGQVSEEGLLRYFDLLFNQVSGDGLRVYLYHFPRMSGVPYSLPLISMMIKEFPEIVVGMKDSSGDIDNMKKVLDSFPGFKLYAGTEDLLLDVLNMGGAGCISATANVTSPVAGQLYEGWKRGEKGGERNMNLIKLRKSFEGQPFTGILKSYMSMIHSDPRWLNIRPPNSLVDEKIVLAIHESIKDL